MPPKGNIVELRKLLTTRFPGLRQGSKAPPPVRGQRTGLLALDALLEGGLLRAAMTEFVGSGDGSGSALVVGRLLEQVAGEGRFMALVDGRDSFDPGAMEAEVLARCLWIRCATAADALKAADLLLRDRNHSLVVLDLKLNPGHELRRISSSIWFRYKRLVAENDTTFLILTPFPLVSGANCRIELHGPLDDPALAASRDEALARLKFSLSHSVAASRDDQAAG